MKPEPMLPRLEREALPASMQAAHDRALAREFGYQVQEEVARYKP